MNKFVIAAFSIIASALYAAPAAATKLEAQVETTVSDVTVYTNGALVTRSAPLRLTVGE
ncbi:MAG: hypothetical protein ACJAQ6_001278, partial [Arenicella sp.]